jgi:hypothetical protein
MPLEHHFPPGLRVDVTRHAGFQIPATGEAIEAGQELAEKGVNLLVPKPPGGVLVDRPAARRKRDRSRLF